MSTELETPSPPAPTGTPASEYENTPPSPEGQGTPPTPDAAVTSVDPPREVDWSQAVDAEGNFTDAAYEFGMPQQWKSIGGLKKSYEELQRMKGLPGSDADPAQVQEYRQANGVPEEATAEAYGLELPEELKDAYDSESLDRITKVANENAHLGHTAMMRAVVSEFGAMELESMQAMEQANEGQREERLEQASQYLESDPNFTGDKRKAALQTVANGLNNALGELGVPADAPEAEALRSFLAENPLGTRILHHYVARTSQDGMPGTGAQDLRSKEELADSIMTNPADPLYEAFHDGTNPAHDNAVKTYWGYMGVKQ